MNPIDARTAFRAGTVPPTAGIEQGRNVLMFITDALDVDYAIS